MSAELCEHCSIGTKFEWESHRVAATDHWVLLARKKQVTLGAMVLLVKRHVESIAELNSEEAKDLVSASALAERSVRNFLPKKVNYLALMMKDPHLHFHLIPRYDGVNKFDGFDFVDDGWPAHPSLNTKTLPPASVVARVVKEMQKASQA